MPYIFSNFWQAADKYASSQEPYTVRVPSALAASIKASISLPAAVVSAAELTGSFSSVAVDDGVELLPHPAMVNTIEPASNNAVNFFIVTPSLLNQYMNCFCMFILNKKEYIIYPFLCKIILFSEHLLHKFSRRLVCVSFEHYIEVFIIAEPCFF